MLFIIGNLILLDIYVYKTYKIKNKLIGSLNFSDLDEDFWKDVK